MRRHPPSLAAPIVRDPMPLSGYDVSPNVGRAAWLAVGILLGVLLVVVGAH